MKKFFINLFRGTPSCTGLLFLLIFYQKNIQFEYKGNIYFINNKIIDKNLIKKNKIFFYRKVYYTKKIYYLCG